VWKPGWSGLIAILLMSSAPASASERAPTPGRAGVAGRPARFLGGGLRGVVLPTPSLGGTYLCGDLHVTRRLSFVGCGSGSGFLYPHPRYPVQAKELTHFRVEWALLQLRTLDLLVGTGLTEAELRGDRPGLVFVPDQSKQAPEAAGAEVVVGLALPAAYMLGRLRIRLDVGTAWIPGLRAIGESSNVVPFTLLTANGRF
jgi:hypothetical protein